MTNLDMDEIAENIFFVLKKYGFRTNAENIFDTEPPPGEIAQIIFDIKRRAAIGMARVQLNGNRWIRINWTVCGEIDEEFVSAKTFPPPPSGISLLNSRGDGTFIARHKAIFPGYEWKKQLKAAVTLLAEFRNPRLLYLRQYQFAVPIIIEVVPPGCAEADRLTNFGGLANAYSMAWLMAQIPPKLSTAQMTELEGISKKWGWHFEQGEPIFQK